MLNIEKGFEGKKEGIQGFVKPAGREISMEKEILVLGAQNSGKTLFIRNVQNFLDNDTPSCRSCHDSDIMKNISSSHYASSESTMPTGNE